MTIRQRSIFFLLLNTLAWGAALPIVKPALPFISPYQFLFYRFVIAGVVSLPLLWYYWPKIRSVSKNVLRISALEILGTGLALSLLYSGLQRTTSIEASLIASTTPILIILMGIWFLKERQTWNEWFGLSLALLGTVLLAIEPLLLGHNGSAQFSFSGNLLIFAQNIVIALYYVLAKKYYATLPKFFVTAVSFWVGVVIFGALELWAKNGDWSLVLSAARDGFAHREVILAVLYMGIVGSIFGLTLYILGQDGIEAGEASIFTYLQPIVALPLGLLFLNERVSFVMVVAVILIAAGVAMAEHRYRRRRNQSFKKTTTRALRPNRRGSPKRSRR